MQWFVVCLGGVLGSADQGRFAGTIKAFLAERWFQLMTSKIQD